MSTIVRLSFDSAGAVVDTGEVTAAAAVQNLDLMLAHR